MSQCNVCGVEHQIAVPTVHLNGTSAKELAEQLNYTYELVRTS